MTERNPLQVVKYEDELFTFTYKDGSVVERTVEQVHCDAVDAVERLYNIYAPNLHENETKDLAVLTDMIGTMCMVDQPWYVKICALSYQLAGHMVAKTPTPPAEELH